MARAVNKLVTNENEVSTGVPALKSALATQAIRKQINLKPDFRKETLGD